MADEAFQVIRVVAGGSAVERIVGLLLKLGDESATTITNKLNFYNGVAWEVVTSA